jgi:soluble lytic murein transglycosylase-like protein
VRKAARDFEGLLLAQLFKVMKNSIRSSQDETLLRSDVLSEFADLELGRVLAERRPIGLSEVVYRSLGNARTLTPPREHSQAAPMPLLPAARAPVPLKQPLPSISPLEPIVARAAERHGLDPRLLHAVIACESAGNPQAQSPRGAKGLMQLVDSTAQMLGVRDVYDPEENVEGGARYLKSLLNRFHQKLEWALAAYNAGPSAVERHQGVPPYAETKRYVKKVLELVQGPGAGERRGS